MARRSRIIAVNSNTYHGYSLEDAIAGIRAAGFRHIELTATKGWTEHVFPADSVQRLCAVKRMLRDAGITPIAMSGHCNLTDPNRKQDFIDNIHMAALYDCPLIVSSIGEAHLSDRATADDAQAAEMIRAFLPHLRAHGMTLALETHGVHATGAIVQNIVRMVDDPLVRVAFDTANVVYYGGVDSVRDLAGCVWDVSYIHLKDKLGAQGEWNFPALGDGDVDFPAIFELLEAADNDSPLSIEIEFTKAGAGSVRAVDEAVLRSAAYLKAQGFAL